jgi:hypothetical protein
MPTINLGRWRLLPGASFALTEVCAKTDVKSKKAEANNKSRCIKLVLIKIGELRIWLQEASLSFREEAALLVKPKLKNLPHHRRNNSIQSGLLNYWVCVHAKALPLEGRPH